MAGEGGVIKIGEVVFVIVWRLQSSAKVIQLTKDSC